MELGSWRSTSSLTELVFTPLVSKPEQINIQSMKKKCSAQVDLVQNVHCYLNGTWHCQ